MKFNGAVFVVVLIGLMFSQMLHAETRSSLMVGGFSIDKVQSVAASSDGGYCIAGYSRSYGKGDYDFMVVKFDSSSNAQWKRTYGDTGSDKAYAIDHTSEGGYIVAGETTSFGLTRSDGWILRLNSYGDVVWQDTHGGSGTERIVSIKQESDGGYCAAGYTNSSGAGNYDFWVLTLDEAGNRLWQKSFGGSGDDKARSIAATSDGGYIVVGETASFGAGEYDFWVLKLSSDGAVEWEKTFGGSDTETATSVLELSDGTFMISGDTYSFSPFSFSNDFWLLKLDASGEVLWNSIYSGTGEEKPFGLQQTADGGYIMAGETETFGAGSYDFWVVKLTGSGEVEWERAYGSKEIEKAYSVEQTLDGGYIVVGESDAIEDMASSGLVLKIDSFGNICPNKTISSEVSWSESEAANVMGNDTSAYTRNPEISDEPTDVSAKQSAIIVEELCQELDVTVIIPEADAGFDQIWYEGAKVTLDGSGSKAEGGDDVIYAWVQLNVDAGEELKLSNADTEKATFKAPTVTVKTVYTFKLTVTDRLGNTDTDQVQVTVLPDTGDTDVVYIPHITGGFSDWKDYLQVDNTGMESAEFTLLLYNHKTIVRVETYSVDALCKMVIDLKDLDEDALFGRVRYSEPALNFRVSQEKVGGGGIAEFTLGSTLSSSLGFYFSDFSSVIEWKGLALSNFSDADVELTLKAIGACGVLEEKTVTIEAYSKLIGLHTTWFPFLELSQVKKIIVSSTATTLTGIVVSGDTASTRLVFTKATTPGTNASIGYIPHITGGFSDWKDYLQVDNTGAISASFSIALFNEGIQVYSGTFTIDPLCESTYDLKALNTSAQNGIVYFYDTNLRFRLSQEKQNGGGIAEFTLANKLSTSLGFYFSDFSEVIEWKGLALSNLGDTATDVTLYAIGSCSILEQASLSLSPKTKVSGVHSEWFPDLDLSQVNSIIAVSSAKSLSGIVESGNADSTRLIFTHASAVSEFP